MMRVASRLVQVGWLAAGIAAIPISVELSGWRSFAVGWCGGSLFSLAVISLLSKRP